MGLELEKLCWTRFDIIYQKKNWLGTIHLRRRQIFHNFWPLPPYGRQFFTTIRRQIWQIFDPSPPKQCRHLKWMVPNCSKNSKQCHLYSEIWQKFVLFVILVNCCLLLFVLGSLYTHCLNLEWGLRPHFGNCDVSTNPHLINWIKSPAFNWILTFLIDSFVICWLLSILEGSLLKS